MTSSAACSISSSSPSMLSSSVGGRPIPSTLATNSGLRCSRHHLVTPSISFSVTQAPWMRTPLDTLAGWKSMSPWPTSFSAPFESRMTREPACDDVMNAMRDGMFALMSPVTTSTDGRCVATTRWMPTARAICAMRQMASSTARGAIIIRSASSSTTTRT